MTDLPVITMTSNRPYLIRALYEWIVDNQKTPYLLVDATRPQVVVPAQFVQDGKIVLNISPVSIQALALGNERIEFNARFGGVAMQVEVPVNAVLGIYARENGHGMLFPNDELPMDGANETNDKPETLKPTRERPTLKVVK